jgi:nitrate/TMAO reductase-like tetraheme cytochrome c subunit
MYSRPFTVLLLAALLSFPAVWAARSQTLFERWVTPGVLIEGHAKYENNCAKCHESFKKGFQKQLCLKCHKDIAEDFKTKKGFHGKRSDILNEECKHCHTDHKGRNADVLLFDQQTFNHSATNYELKGAHKTLRCSQCHKPKSKETIAREIETDSPTGRYRKSGRECVDCHKKIEPHKTRLGDLCQNCHYQDTWKRKKKFDHDKTKFKLVNSHRKVSCVACHPQERWKGAPMTCAGCHPLQDVHRGRYGSKCENCHEPKKWTVNHFDHDKTKFKLRNAHEKVKCDACHPGHIYKDKNKLGQNCENCHSDKGWRQKVFFDHDITRFPLIGRHATAPCEECHRNTSYKGTTTKCADCHQDKRHEGRFGVNCARCHNPNGWDLWRFDHNKRTRFPLRGEHAKVSCYACHKEKHAVKISLPTNCYGCHSADDAHEGAYGRSCEQCHTPSSFRDVKIGR